MQREFGPDDAVFASAGAPLPNAKLTETIIGGFFETAAELGIGMNERLNQRALQVVLIDRGLKADIDVLIPVHFRGRRIGKFFADVIVNETVLIEVKAAPSIEERDIAQTLNYLRCAGGGIALLVNFWRSVTFKRFVIGDPANCLPILREPRKR